MGVAKFKKRLEVFKMEDGGNKGMGSYLYTICPY